MLAHQPPASSWGRMEDPPSPETNAKLRPSSGSVFGSSEARTSVLAALEVAEEVRPGVGVLVAGRDDRPPRPRFLVDIPTRLVGLPPDLHQPHVLVPAAYPPDRIVRRQLVPDVEAVVRAEDPRCRLHDEDTLVFERGLNTKIPLPENAKPIHSSGEELLVTTRSIETRLIMVSDRGEVGEVGPEDAVDLLLPARRIIEIVEVALVQHSIGAFVLDQFEDRLGVRTHPLVADESDRDVGR